MTFDVRIDNIEMSREIPDSEFTLLPENPLPRQISAAKAAMTELRKALDAYAIDNHAYPTTLQGLSALVQEPDPKPRKWKGPYLTDTGLLKDPWGNAYAYRSPRPGINPDGYDLFSWGPDGKGGTRDDLSR